MRFHEGSSTTYYPPGSFVTVMCTAQSHEEWGIQTFTRGSAGWMPSTNLQMLGGAPASPGGAGKQLHQRGVREPVQRLSAEGRVLSDADDDVWAERVAPGVYDRITLRCSRCGDGFPVTWKKLTPALDALAATGRHFFPLSALRRVVSKLRT